MRFNLGVNHASKGLGDLVASFVGAPEVSAQARRRRETQIGRALLTQAQADKAQSETAINRDTLAARGGLGDSFARLLQSAGASPTLGVPAAGAFRASGGNAAQLGDLFSTVVNAGRQRSAIARSDAGDPTGANIRLAASGRTPVTPFRQTTGGLVLNQATGAQDQSSPAAQATIGDIAARAAASLGTAADRNASAASTSALLQPKINTEVARTAELNARAGRGPGGKPVAEFISPTAAEVKNAKALLKQFIPKELQDAINDEVGTITAGQIKALTRRGVPFLDAARQVAQGIVNQITPGDTGNGFNPFDNTDPSFDFSGPGNAPDAPVLAPTAPQHTDPNLVLQQARDAILQGAPLDAVSERLRSLGLNPLDL